LATRIRLKRVGAKHNPHYRVVVMASQAPRDSRAVEEIGFYDPSTEPLTVQIDADRAMHWLMCGAIPSETVSSLLKRVGIEVPGKEKAA